MRLQVFYTLLLLGFISADAQERECECVDYWLCKDGRIVTDGTDLLDVRLKTCPGIEVCCLPDDEDIQPISSTTQFLEITRPTTETTVTRTPPDNQPTQLQIPDVSSGGGCGRARSPPGLDTLFKVTGNNGPPEATFYGEAPWMVVILEQDRKFKCGGTLISPTVVLTAAHCVQNMAVSDLSVRAGEYDNRIPQKPLPSQTRRVVRVSSHPNFNPANLHNDIALIFLDNAMELNAVVDVVCAPESADAVVGEACIVTGWGRNATGGKYQGVLSKVNLQLRSRDYCVDTLRTSRLGKRFRLHEGFICAGGGDGRDTCEGDGGGPLICPSKEDRNKMVQVGVVAWGIGCGDGYPTVMTSVQYYMPWLQSQMS